MNTQTTELFDLGEGRRRAKEGMKRAADAADPKLLEYASRLVIAIAKSRGSVNADDVNEHFHNQGLPLLGNALGSVFQKCGLKKTGIWKPSRRKEARGRNIQSWS